MYTGGPSRALARALIALASLHAILFLAPAIARLFYPYEVSWQEGNMLAMCLRALDGRPLYDKPSLDYAAFLYSPLYFQVSAQLMRLVGPGYAAMRAVSIASTLAVAGGIFVVARREGARAEQPSQASGGARSDSSTSMRPLLALAGVGLWLGFYSRASFYYDSGRVDALATALTFFSAQLAVPRSASPGRVAVAGVLGALAVLAKQSSLAYVAAIALLPILDRRRVALLYAFVTAATLLGTLEASHLLGNRWFWYYVVTVPAEHHLRLHKLLGEVPLFLAATIPVGLWLGLRPLWQRASERLDAWALLVVVALAAGALMRSKDGGSNNHFIPLVAFAAVQLARVGEAFLRAQPRLAGSLLVLQLAMLLYVPTVMWPTRADVAAGDRLLERLRALPGDVLVPTLPAYAARAGKPWHAHYSALCDIAQFDLGLRHELEEAVKARRYAAILPRTDVQAQDVGLCDVPGLESSYHVAATLDVPPAPSALELALGKPSLFAFVHADKVGPIYEPGTP